MRSRPNPTHSAVTIYTDRSTLFISDTTLYLYLSIAGVAFILINHLLSFKILKPSTIELQAGQGGNHSRSPKSIPN
jgi:hypothetical protein